MSVSSLRRGPAANLHEPLARCYAYLSMRMGNIGEGRIDSEVARFRAMNLYEESLPLTHMLYEKFGDSSWRDAFEQDTGPLPRQNLPFPSLRRLLRYLRVNTTLLDSKAKSEETLFSDIVDKDRAWFITLEDISGITLEGLLGFVGCLLPLFSEIVVGRAFQSVEHYHILAVSPWPMYKQGVSDLFRGLHPRSVSAVRNLGKARNYIMRQSLEAEVYRAGYRTYVPEDLLGEINDPTDDAYNLPRYSLPLMPYVLPMEILGKEGSELVINDVSGNALAMAERLLGKKGVYRGGPYMDQAVSLVGTQFPCAVISIV